MPHDPVPSTLPHGLTARPATPDDLLATLDLLRAYERAAHGTAMVEEEDVAGSWRQLGDELGAYCVLVHDGERLVGFAEDHPRERLTVAVSPDDEGRGIGTWLLGWATTRARAAGRVEVAQSVPAGSSSEHLLVAAGAQPRYDAWLLRLGAGRPVPTVTLPEGVTITAAEPDELPVAHALVERCFDWAGRVPMSYVDWCARFLERADAEPWHVRVARDGGQVVGVALVTPAEGDVAFVHELAVERPHRGRGIGRALLGEALGQGRTRGLAVGELSTHSLSGALGLYLDAGMEVVATWRHLVVTV